MDLQGTACAQINVIQPPTIRPGFAFLPGVKSWSWKCPGQTVSRIPFPVTHWVSSLQYIRSVLDVG